MVWEKLQKVREKTGKSQGISFSRSCGNPELISNGLIAFKFYTEVKNLKLHKKKMSMTRLTPKLHSLTTLVSPKSSKCNISMNNGPIALKFCTGVQSQ